jgi:hypothetical protein
MLAAYYWDCQDARGGIIIHWQVGSSSVWKGASRTVTHSAAKRAEKQVPNPDATNKSKRIFIVSSLALF